MDLLFEAHLSTTAYFTTFRRSVKGFLELLFGGFFPPNFCSYVNPGWDALGI